MNLNPFHSHPSNNNFQMIHVIHPILLKWILIIILLGHIGLFSSVFAQEPGWMGEVLNVGKFSDADPIDPLPEGWEPLFFKNIENHTDYRLAKDGDTLVVRAESKASSSGLIRKRSVFLRKRNIKQPSYYTANIRRLPQLIIFGRVTRQKGRWCPIHIRNEPR